MWPCSKDPSESVRCLSPEFETEAVLVVCEGSAERSWVGFGAEAALYQRKESRAAPPRKQEPCMEPGLTLHVTLDPVSSLPQF